MGDVQFGGADFFSSRLGETMILNCYRLAKYYSVAPDVFLTKPISQLSRDIHYTNRLIEEVTAAMERK